MGKRKDEDGHSSSSRKKKKERRESGERHQAEEATTEAPRQRNIIKISREVAVSASSVSYVRLGIHAAR